MTYAHLHDQVERCAASLQRLGVRPGDRVALYLPNCPQFVITYLACLRVGGIAVPFNPLYSGRETEYQLRDCGARIAVVLDRFFPLVNQVRANTPLRRVVVTSAKEYFPPALWLLYTLTAERRQPRFRSGRRTSRSPRSWSPGRRSPSPSARGDRRPALHRGTTGVSRGVELSHRNLLVNAEQNRSWAGLEPGAEVTLAALPLFHAFGLTCCLNLGMLTGSTLILVPNPTDVRGLVQTIHRFRPTVFPVVPTMLVAISNFPDLARYDLRSVRVSPCAGSPLAPAVQRTFIERTGVRPVEGYGLTEAAPVVMGNPPFGDDRHGTIGLPYPDTEVRVVDFETGKRDMPFEGTGRCPGRSSCAGRRS